MKKKLIAFLFLVYIVFFYHLLLAHPLLGNKSVVEVELLRVIDGDTIKVNLPSCFDWMLEDVSIRLLGYDTPELRGGTMKSRREARKARDFVDRLIRSGAVLTLRNVSKADSFGRPLAEILVDDQSLGELLYLNDLAEPF